MTAPLVSIVPRWGSAAITLEVKSDGHAQLTAPDIVSRLNATELRAFAAAAVTAAEILERPRELRRSVSVAQALLDREEGV